MNRVRVGILLIAVATLGAVAIGVAAAFGATLAQLAVLAVAAELVFWGGVALLGYSTYKVARAKGLRRVPAELWRLFRAPSPTRPGSRDMTQR